MRATLVSVLLFLAAVLAAPAAAQQPPAPPPAPPPEPAPAPEHGLTPEMEQTFRRLAAELAAERLDGDDTDEDVEEEALELLDALATAALADPAADLDSLNARLAALAGAPARPGESYRIARLAPRAAGVRYYALAANFGPAGPAAARVYSCRNDECRLVGAVDADTDAELLDENLVVHPIDADEPVFVVITGRTDELSTGAFAAWRFTPAGLARLWDVELSPRADYDPLPDGVLVRYCAEPDMVRPEICLRMVRERWGWRDGAWRRLPEP